MPVGGGGGLYDLRITLFFREITYYIILNYLRITFNKWQLRITDIQKACGGT